VLDLPQVGGLPGKGVPILMALIRKPTAKFEAKEVIQTLIGVNAQKSLTTSMVSTSLSLKIGRNLRYRIERSFSQSSIRQNTVTINVVVSIREISIPIRELLDRILYGRAIYFVCQGSAILANRVT
jgi:hypothetical protein